MSVLIPNILGLKNDDLASCRSAVIITKTINEQVIAGDIFELHYRFTFAKCFTWLDAGMLRKTLAGHAIKSIRFFAAGIPHRDADRVDKLKKMLRRTDVDQFAIFLGDLRMVESSVNARVKNPRQSSGT